MKARAVRSSEFPTKERREEVKNYVMYRLVFMGLNFSPQIEYGYSICVGEYVKIEIEVGGTKYEESAYSSEKDEFIIGIDKALRRLSGKIPKAGGSNGRQLHM